MGPAELAHGKVEAHYLLCPYCGRRKKLYPNVCSGCGAECVTILWKQGSVRLTPELAMVSR